MKKIVLCSILVLFICVGFFVQHTVTSSSDSVENRPIATVTLSTEETFKIALYPEYAPNTVNNFIYLAQVGFYDGTCIDRLLPGLTWSGCVWGGRELL